MALVPSDSAGQPARSDSDSAAQPGLGPSDPSSAAPPAITTSCCPDHAALSMWQLRHWCHSEECKGAIKLLLALRAGLHDSRVQNILAQMLPSFLAPRREDAFLALLHQGTISDVRLLNSFVDFLTGWTRLESATVGELLADPSVAQEANALLPEEVPMWRWVTSRLHTEIELKADPAGAWHIELHPQSSLPSQIAQRYRETYDII